MATKLRVSTPGGRTSDYDLKGEVAPLTRRVNQALQKNEKFVVFALKDGERRSFVAADVVSIWEE